MVDIQGARKVFIGTFIANLKLFKGTFFYKFKLFKGTWTFTGIKTRTTACLHHAEPLGNLFEEVRTPEAQLAGVLNERLHIASRVTEVDGLEPLAQCIPQP